MTSRPRKHLHSKEKQNVASVLNYFLANGSDSKGTCLQKTAEATGVSRATVGRIEKELRDNGRVMSPVRRKRGPYKPLDGFDRDVVRNKVREFCTTRRQLPTLRMLLKVLKEDIDFPGGRESLRLTLKRMGFKWKRTSNNRQQLIEKPSVFRQRLQFYMKKQELEDQGYTLVYTDETWIDSAYTMKSCWQGPDFQGACPPLNKGQRLIIVHAGTRAGFIPGAKLV